MEREFKKGDIVKHWSYSKISFWKIYRLVHIQQLNEH